MQWVNNGADKMAKRYETHNEEQKDKKAFCRSCLNYVEAKMVRTMRFIGKKVARCPVCNEEV